MKISDTVLYEARYPITTIRTVQFRAPKDLEITSEIEKMIANSIDSGISSYFYYDEEEWNDFEELTIDLYPDREIEHAEYATKLVLLPDTSESSKESNDVVVLSLQRIDRYEEEPSEE